MFLSRLADGLTVDVAAIATCLPLRAVEPPDEVRRGRAALRRRISPPDLPAFIATPGKALNVQIFLRPSHLAFESSRSSAKSYIIQIESALCVFPVHTGKTFYKH